VTDSENIYRSQWDSYAEQSKEKFLSSGSGWPGDEWGNEQAWADIFKAMFLDFSAETWEHAVEIGGGSGKYTKKLLDASPSKIIAFDISAAYQKIMKERLVDYIDCGRLDTVVIEGKVPSELYDYINYKGLVRKLDAFFSIDAMVHVDLQYLTTYFLTAALTLKPEGHLVMTLTNAVSSSGFQHLLLGVKRFYNLQGKPSAKFEWLSPEIVRTVLSNMGFLVTFVPVGHLGVARDLFVVAKMSDPDKANHLRSFLL
jgi:cyclopropane fatty-acyl-phospholipid synthase-like methyltransferase